jgi:hypothetical protein
LPDVLPNAIAIELRVKLPSQQEQPWMEKLSLKKEQKEGG